ncbi:MAG: SH3 domain-containing protein [Pirellulales bacterium]
MLLNQNHRKLARTFIVSSIFFSLSMAATVSAEQPYTAKVIQKKIEVRSGPGLDFYATDYLKSGDVIEVYQTGADGWLAIRPPHGSYSWLPAKYVELTDEPNIGKIIATDLVPKIGSSIGTQRDTHQIKLTIGELVEVIESKEVELERNRSFETWYKIAPPAGEFRWVHSREVERGNFTLPSPEVKKTATPESSIASEKRPTTNSPSSPQANWTAKEFSASPIEVVPNQRFASSAVPVSPEPISNQGPVVSDRSSTWIQSEQPVEQQLMNLELALSRQVLKPSDQWDMEDLIRQSKSLLNAGRTPLERGKARLMIEKIQQFEELRLRKVALKQGIFPQSINDSTDESAEVELATIPVRRTSLNEELETSNIKDYNITPIETDIPDLLSSIANQLPIGSGLVGSNQEIDPRFDGKGWLMPVIKRSSKKRSDGQLTPPYALTDQDGKVLQFVSPSPGVNMHRYLKQEIGIYGQKSPKGNYTRPHLTAHRIVLMSRHEKK